MGASGTAHMLRFCTHGFGIHQLSIPTLVSSAILSSSQPSLKVFIGIALAIFNWSLVHGLVLAAADRKGQKALTSNPTC